MQRLVLDIEESRYALLLQFLKTLNYVRVKTAHPNVSTEAPTHEGPSSSTQLARLLQVLNRPSKPAFGNITDPVAWQKQQRDEWA